MSDQHPDSECSVLHIRVSTIPHGTKPGTWDKPPKAKAACGKVVARSDTTNIRTGYADCPKCLKTVKEEETGASLSSLLLFRKAMIDRLARNYQSVAKKGPVTRMILICDECPNNVTAYGARVAYDHGWIAVRGIGGRPDHLVCPDCGQS